MAAAIEVRAVSKRFRLYHERYSSFKERVIHFGTGSRTRTSGAYRRDADFEVAEG